LWHFPMTDRIKYRAFTRLFDESVIELTSSIEIQPLLTTDKAVDGTLFAVEALWDTGATVTCVKPELFNRLKLCLYDVTNYMKLSGIGGEVKANFTFMNLFFSPAFEIKYCPVFVVDFPGDADILIGMDIIRKGDFAVCNDDNKTSFSFVIPSFSGRIDFADKAEAANK